MCSYQKGSDDLSISILHEANCYALLTKPCLSLSQNPPSPLIRFPCSRKVVLYFYKPTQAGNHSHMSHVKSNLWSTFYRRWQQFSQRWKLQKWHGRNTSTMSNPLIHRKVFRCRPNWPWAYHVFSLISGVAIGTLDWKPSHDKSSAPSIKLKKFFQNYERYRVVPKLLSTMIGSRVKMLPVTCRRVAL